MLPVLGACTEAELVLVVDGVDQFPKKDVTAGWAVGCLAVMEPVEAVPVGVLVIPGKTDGLWTDETVVLLVDPNTEDTLLEETVEAGGLLLLVVVEVVVRDGGVPKPAPAAASPKMGLKFRTEGLLSAVGVAEEVVVTAKMGLNPEASRGLVLLTDPALLAGAVAVTGIEAEEAAGALSWLTSPNRPDPATGVLLEALETWPST